MSVETEGFVGRIVVTKASKTITEGYNANTRSSERKVDRHIVEVLDVTVRSDTEGKVKQKLEQALELLNEDEIARDE